MDYIELRKVLMKDKPSSELRERREELSKLIPEIAETFDFDQKSKWHKYDVFEHTLHVIDETIPDYRLRLAALFHDIGKPRMMYIDENGEGHFHYHWEESEKIFIKYQNNLNLTEEDIYLIQKLIFYHDLTIKNDNTQLFLSEFDNEGLKLLFELKKADALAHNEASIPERLESIELARKQIEKEQTRLGYMETISTKQDEDDTILLLAAFCNSTENFVFKTKKGNSSEFLVGISTAKGICTYKVPLEYWDYFKITEVDNIDITDESTKEDKISKLKSIIAKKSNNLRGK